MKLICFTLIICSFHQSIYSNNLPVYPHDKAELDASYWHRISEDSLRNAYNRKHINKKAKNAIIFLGDGMGISTITSARILKGQLDSKSGEEYDLVFDKFPYISLIKTYNVDYQVPDSAGTATAFLCGVKTNKGVLGVNARVAKGVSNCNLIEDNSVSSILQWAIDSGKSAGIVTTTRITHATPAGAYAHIGDRDWEAFIDSKNNDVGRCKDIARQLIEDKPGSQLKVILGGGWRGFLPNTQTDPKYEIGIRKDGKNLIEEWINEKKYRTRLNTNAYKYVDTVEKLNQVNYDQIEYLFGLFNSSHLSYEIERNKSSENEPSLEEMTEAAIKVLSKDLNGFVLLVEGGRIDHAHHDNYGALSLYETLAFEKAIKKSVSMLPQSETLTVVTADHSHTFTINGYPERGNSIFGIASYDSSNKPFTTLMYSNGPGFERNITDISTVNTADLRYRQLSAVHLSSSNHGGEDIAVYSTGPMAHLFEGTQEQTYVAHVMAFATCIGRYTKEDHCLKPLENSANIRFHFDSMFINISMCMSLIIALKIY